MLSHHRFFVFTILSVLGPSTAAFAASTIGDFNTWTLVQDPPHSGMSASLNSLSQATLIADGAIPAGVDIGYQSVDPADVATSTSGFYFSASESFQVAVDFGVTMRNSSGLAAIGMGIGEDGAGANSAGPALAVANGSPLQFSAGARINDVTQAPALFGPAAKGQGRFFARYDAATGNIEYGVSTTPGAAAPTHTGEFLALQNDWNDDDLLVSFFLRSDEFIIPPLSEGEVEAVFSNFEVLEGTPIAATTIPEPATALLIVAAWAGVARQRRRR